MFTPLYTANYVKHAIILLTSIHILLVPSTPRKFSSGLNIVIAYKLGVYYHAYYSMFKCYWARIGV